MGRKTILHYSKKCPSIIDERFCLEGIESMLCPVSLTGLWRRNGDLRVVPATCKGFFRFVYTNLKSFRTSCDAQASLLSLF